MPIIFRKFDDFVKIIRDGFKDELPSIDSSVNGSFALGFNKGTAGACSALELKIRDVLLMLFPQFSKGIYLDLWGNWQDLPRPEDKSGKGNVSLPGIVGTSIPDTTQFRGSNGIIYTVTSLVPILISNNVGVISQIVSSPSSGLTTVTVSTEDEHSLASGLNVLISGITPPEFNGIFPVIVTGRKEFIYTIDQEILETPSGTSMAFESDYADLEIEADSEGGNTNLSGGAFLNLTSSIVGADPQGYSQFDGIFGGADIMIDDPYRDLILFSRSVIKGVFAASDVEIAVRSISGNTRVWIKEMNPTNSGGYESPTPGQLSVFFVRDNDVDIFPNPAQTLEAKTAIIENSKATVNTFVGDPPDYEGDVFVNSPLDQPIDFEFGTISPNTETMKTAIIENLKAFFEDNVNFEQTITQDSYRGAINNTVDPTTGEALKIFVLINPNTNIIGQNITLFTLRDVTFE